MHSEDEEYDEKKDLDKIRLFDDDLKKSDILKLKESEIASLFKVSENIEEIDGRALLLLEDKVLTSLDWPKGIVAKYLAWKNWYYNCFDKQVYDVIGYNVKV